MPVEEALPEGEELAPPGVRAMAIARWVMVGLVALLALGTWVRWARTSPPDPAATGQYQCPMHPAVIAAAPGPCPICGMDLVRVQATAKAAGPAAVPGLVPVELTPERIQLIGMRTAPVAREHLASGLRTVGFVTADEGGIALVSARFAGWIERLLVSQSGTYVRKGQRLAAIYSPDLIAAQQVYLNAIKWESDKDVASGKKTSPIERDARTRLQLSGMLDEDIDELARARRLPRVIYARSPIDGYVGKKAAVTGLYVQPGAELYEIADLSSLWVIADVYASDIDRVKVGQKATITVPGATGLRLDGEVSFLYPAIATASRTLQARVTVKNPGLRLRPGMFVDVTLGVGAVKGLAIPSEAVVDTGELQYAFVKGPEGRIEPRRLRLGLRTPGRVQVLEGVAEGELVVTTANFLVDSESRLRAAIEGLARGPAPEAGPPAAQDGDDHERREAPAHEAGEHGPGATTGEAAEPMTHRHGGS